MRLNVGRNELWGLLPTRIDLNEILRCLRDMNPVRRLVITVINLKNMDLNFSIWGELMRRGRGGGWWGERKMGEGEGGGGGGGGGREDSWTPSIGALLNS